MSEVVVEAEDEGVDTVGFAQSGEKFACALEADFVVEGQEDDVVDARRFEPREAVFERGQQSGLFQGSDNGQGVAGEGDDGGRQSAARGFAPKIVDQKLMSGVDTVIHPDGGYAPARRVALGYNIHNK